MNDNPAQNNGEWLVVYETYNSPDAYIVSGRLQNEGIDTFIQEDPLGTAMGLHIGEIGIVRVLVNPSNYERAELILAQDVDAEAIDADDDTEE